MMSNTDSIAFSDAEQPKKRTFKRKKMSTLKDDGSGGRMIVDVEVRKKRKFVKRTLVTAVNDTPLCKEDAHLDNDVPEHSADVGSEHTSIIELDSSNYDVIDQNSRHVDYRDETPLDDREGDAEIKDVRVDLPSVKMSNSQPIADGATIIRVKDTPAYIGVSKSTYHNYRNSKSNYYEEDFPVVITMSQNCKGHFKADLDAWLESKKCAALSSVQEVTV